MLLLASRDRFTARPDPRSLNRLVEVVLGGTVLATVLGWLWLAIDADGQAPGTTLWQRVDQAFLGLVGIPGPVRFVDPDDSARAAVALVVLGASVLLLAVLVALQPANGPHGLDDDRPRPAARPAGPVGRHRLAVVLCAARRPVGDLLPQRQGGDHLPGRRHRLARRRGPDRRPRGLAGGHHGLARRGPLVRLGAGGARRQRARRRGLPPARPGRARARRRGRPATWRSSPWTGRSMRGVRQAVARCERAGLPSSATGSRDLDDATLASCGATPTSGGTARSSGASRWRWAGSATAPTADAVRGRAATRGGELRGLLHFVPWGSDGLSLDLMRRDRDAENGIVEQMVAGLMARRPALGVRAGVAELRRLPQRLRPRRAARRRAGAAGVAGDPAARPRGSGRSSRSTAPTRSTSPSGCRASCASARRPTCPGSASPALRAEAFLVAPGWVQRLAAR